MNILLVDDSRMMRCLIAQCLREANFKNLEIIEAADGLQALEVVKKQPIDLILSDWNMPNLLGIDFLRELKKLVDSAVIKQMIPFVFITSECSMEMRELANDEGALDFITKPFTADILKMRLERVME